jgi:epoxyqueuosine reductase
MHGNMQFMLKKIKAWKDIRSSYPDACSILVFAHNYFTGHSYPDDPSGKYGKISRHAWGDDYHHVIKDKLLKIVDFIQSAAPDSINKAYVDSGPLPEKQLALRSGIGWQGKNGVVISKELGSWFFLGIIVTSLKFEPSEPSGEHCGTCRLCIEACPNAAIIQPQVIDCRKCIAYYTIELKPEDEIPPGIELAGWLYGCDICQEVCPWNSIIEKTSESRFFPRNGETALELKKAMDITDDEFKERFNGSTIRRIKPQGLRRNAMELKKRSKKKL